MEVKQVHLIEEKISDCERVMKITVPVEQINERINSLYEKYQKSVKVNGFRKGKVPMSIIKSRYGNSVKEEAVNNSIRDAYKEIATKDKINPISEILIKDTKFDEKEGLSFSLNFDVMPDIKLKDYKGIAVTRTELEVNKEEITQVISKLQNANAIYIPTVGHFASADDMVVVNCEILEEEKGIYRKNKVPNYSILLDDARIPEEIKETLENSMPGDSRKASVRYPVDFEDPKLRGKIIEYSFLVQDVKTKKLPALDNEFAKGLGFETMEAMEKEISNRIKKDKELELKAKIGVQIINSLIENNPFTPPKNLVMSYLEPLVKEQSRLTAGEKIDEKIRKNLEEIAVWRAKRELLLSKIADVENIIIVEEEIKTKLLQTEQARLIEGKKIGYEQLVKSLKQKNVYDMIIEEIRLEKTMDFLRGEAKYT